MSFSTSPAHPVTYPLSLHDALPISLCSTQPRPHSRQSSVTDLSKYGNEPSHIQSIIARLQRRRASLISDRKSTRLNSSHANISYAVFCLKKKNNHRCHSDRTDHPTN